MTEKDYQRKKNKFLPKIHAWVQEHGGETIIPFSCALERNLADMPPDEAAKYCEENKTQRSVQSICCTVVKCLIAKLGTLLWLCYG
ncbi:Obg-like ATPase 1 [Glycine soja]|uniref:Obg-like ATPase 1 n=1 Tax=Glycine soja TaxID=3848 RepID=A0A0B2QT37_GLYSO|nr:Obg-like ATPase 1 [Glycine soja]